MKTPKFSNSPTIRAYQYLDKIVVKYFDDGSSELLSCPHCHWFGKVDASEELGSSPTVELTCPHCHSSLGTISAGRS